MRPSNRLWGTLPSLLLTYSFAGLIAAAQPKALPSGLIALPGASNLHQTAEHDGTASYELADEYPARRPLSLLTETLQLEGWKPLREDFLNPGILTSQARGWTEFEDATGRNSRYLYEWHGQWQDSTGRVVWYVFSYEGERTNSGYAARSPLRVRAAVFSAAAVASARRKQTH
jgi:hypothetical protein